MKRFIAKFLATALFLLLLSGTANFRESKANSQTVYGYTCVSYVPAEWGEFRGGNQQSGLAFQDRTGTLRFVTNLPCDSHAQPALEIRRTPPKSD